MRRVVLDTSALIRLYIPDGELPEGLETAVEGAASGDVALLVPELALVEIAQVLRKKELTGHLTSAECDEVLDAILELPLDVVGHHDLLRDAIAFSRSTHLTAYDALFLALAVDRRAELISADSKLVEAFESSGQPRRGNQS